MTDEEARGVVGAATELGSKVIAGLPAQFLLLCCVNVIFLGTVFWFLNLEQQARVQLENSQMEARERVLLPILQACIQHGLEPQSLRP